MCVADPDDASRAYRTQTRTAFFATLQRSNLTYSIEQELDMAPEIFDGATVRIANLADMNALGNSAAIKVPWLTDESRGF
jgi:hypothetical protein